MKVQLPNTTNDTRPAAQARRAQMHDTHDHAGSFGASLKRAQTHTPAHHAAAAHPAAADAHREEPATDKSAADGADDETGTSSSTAKGDRDHHAKSAAFADPSALSFANAINDGLDAQAAGESDAGDGDATKLDGDDTTAKVDASLQSGQLLQGAQVAQPTATAPAAQAAQAVQGAQAAAAAMATAGNVAAQTAASAAGATAPAPAAGKTAIGATAPAGAAKARDAAEPTAPLTATADTGKTILGARTAGAQVAAKAADTGSNGNRPLSPAVTLGALSGAVGTSNLTANLPDDVRYTVLPNAASQAALLVGAGASVSPETSKLALDGLDADRAQRDGDDDVRDASSSDLPGGFGPLSGAPSTSFAAEAKAANAAAPAAPVAEPTDTTHHAALARAAVTVGEGADRVSVVISASAHHVRVTAETASAEMAGALNRSGDQLRHALRQHGLELSQLSADSGQSSLARESRSNEPGEQQQQQPRRSGLTITKSESETPRTPTTRAGWRVLA